MPRRRDVPDDLIGRPIRAGEAEARGLSTRFLRRRFVAMYRGIWWYGEPPRTPEPWLRAALMASPPGAVLSHVSALRVMGIDIRPVLPVHTSTNSTRHRRVDDLIVHRRRGPIWRDERDDLPITTPERSFVDSATILGLRDLVRVGDALVDRGLTTPGRLAAFCDECHLDGVVRARRAVGHVRTGVESFLETDVRLMLIFARLPVDGCNVDILDDSGRFIARGDILCSAYRVLVEYDGWQHERDAQQRQKDHLRRERLEAHHWRVIVVTIEDMGDPDSIVERVHSAVRQRGFRGRRPTLSFTWRRWFAA